MLETLWGKLAAANSDPLGPCDQVRAHHNAYWLGHDWREVYPRIDAELSGGGQDPELRGDAGKRLRVDRKNRIAFSIMQVYP